MPLSEEEKSYIVDRVVEILSAPNRAERIAALRQQVLEEGGERNELDDAVYAVVQAVEELQG
jgi:hypothetical protein